MKKFIFTLVAAFVASMSVSAQMVKLIKNGEVVAAFDKNQADEILFCDVEEKEMVDLGLSVKWASTNLGADSPEKVGDYYAWGEVAPKPNKTYSWNNYKFRTGSGTSVNKYCTDFQYGAVDGRTKLLNVDDAAQMKIGGKWRMPSDENVKELTEKCTWTWTTNNGVKGYDVKGPNGNSIFLPVTGVYSGSEFIGRDQRGDYWTNTLMASDNTLSVSLSFSSSSKILRNSPRISGMAIRPVYAEHDYVDLGLPSGLKWATCNVGADSPEMAGDFYAWGEVEAKKTFSQSDYKVTEFKDVAAEKWGGSWRMPTSDEIRELNENCQIQETRANGAPGVKITGPNGNSIFVPCAGHFTNDERSFSERGYYWTSTLLPDAPTNASAAIIGDAYAFPIALPRYCGMNVRPVCP